MNDAMSDTPDGHPGNQPHADVKDFPRRGAVIEAEGGPRTINLSFIEGISDDKARVNADALDLPTIKDVSFVLIGEYGELDAGRAGIYHGDTV
jgi:hypothetical protein